MRTLAFTLMFLLSCASAHAEVLVSELTGSINVLAQEWVDLPLVMNWELLPEDGSEPFPYFSGMFNSDDADASRDVPLTACDSSMLFCTHISESHGLKVWSWFLGDDTSEAQDWIFGPLNQLTVDGDYVADAPQRTLSVDEMWHVDGTSFNFSDISRIEFTLKDYFVTQDVEVEAFGQTYIRDRVDVGFSMRFYTPVPESSSALLVIASSLTLMLTTRPTRTTVTPSRFALGSCGVAEGPRGVTGTE